MARGLTICTISHVEKKNRFKINLTLFKSRISQTVVKGVKNLLIVPFSRGENKEFLIVEFTYRLKKFIALKCIVTVLSMTQNQPAESDVRLVHISIFII